MEHGGTSAGRIKQRGRKNVKRGHRSVERDVRRYIRLGIPERGTTDGSVTKGDGPRFAGHKKEYRNRLCDCGILTGDTLCCLVRLLLLALSFFPTVHIGYIRIEGTCSFAETLLVDFTVVDFLGDTFRFFTVFGNPVEDVVRAVVVGHPAPNVIAVAVPFRIFARGFQNIGDVASQNLVALPPTMPQPKVSEHDNNAVHLFVQVAPFIVQPVINFFRLFFIADLVGVIVQHFPLGILIILLCCFVQQVVACPNRVFHTF